MTKTVAVVASMGLALISAYQVQADPKVEKPKVNLEKPVQALDEPDEKHVKEEGRLETKTKVKASEGAEKNNPNAIGLKSANLKNNNKDFETYLDRLMMAESGGNVHAKNPRSSALGPYQFIRSTFLSVARRHFADEVKGLSDTKILSLRTDRKFARRAAGAYSRENAAHLAAANLKTTYGNLRLAFLLGASGAVKILKAKPKARVSTLLGRGVIKANPFMARMTVQDLIGRAIRDIDIDPSRQLAVAGGTKAAKAERIRVRCNLSRPSCRRWLALKKKRLKVKARKKARKALKKPAKGK